MNLLNYAPFWSGQLEGLGQWDDLHSGSEVFQLEHAKVFDVLTGDQDAVSVRDIRDDKED